MAKIITEVELNRANQVMLSREGYSIYDVNIELVGHPEKKTHLKVLMKDFEWEGA